MNNPILQCINLAKGNTSALCNQLPISTRVVQKLMMYLVYITKDHKISDQLAQMAHSPRLKSLAYIHTDGVWMMLCCEGYAHRRCLGDVMQ